MRTLKLEIPHYVTQNSALCLGLSTVTMADCKDVFCVLITDLWLQNNTNFSSAIPVPEKQLEIIIAGHTLME